MHNPAFYIPDFSELHKATCEFVKKYQGTKGYIDTQPDLGKDIIYALVYTEDGTLTEVVVYGIKYDEEYDALAVAWEPIASSYVVEYTERDYESVDWYRVALGCDIYYPATLINIAELIHEYI